MLRIRPLLHPETLPQLYSMLSAFSSSLNSELFATARKDFGKISLEGLLGQSFREVNSKSTNVSSTNLGIPSVLTSL
jgi:hypothetical protein